MLQPPQAYCFPEKYQMLLNKADALYFSNNVTNWKSPAWNSHCSTTLYQMENVSQITIRCIAQLQSLYSQATIRLSQISTGQDIFGHTATDVQEFISISMNPVLPHYWLNCKFWRVQTLLTQSHSRIVTISQITYKKLWTSFN